MEATCKNCGKLYLSKRGTSKFCSDACRSKSHKKEKIKVISAPVDVALPVYVEQAWVPSKRESILNKVIEESVSNIWKIECLAQKLENSAIVAEIIAIAKQATSVTFHNEVRQEVDGFDMTQRMYEWDAFEARTGMVVLHKKKPL